MLGLAGRLSAGWGAIQEKVHEGLNSGAVAGGHAQGRLAGAVGGAGGQDGQTHQGLQCPGGHQQVAGGGGHQGQAAQGGGRGLPGGELVLGDQEGGLLGDRLGAHAKHSGSTVDAVQAALVEVLALGADTDGAALQEPVDVGGLQGLGGDVQAQAIGAGGLEHLGDDLQRRGGEVQALGRVRLGTRLGGVVDLQQRDQRDRRPLPVGRDQRQAHALGVSDHADALHPAAVLLLAHVRDDRLDRCGQVLCPAHGRYSGPQPRCHCWCHDWPSSAWSVLVVLVVGLVPGTWCRSLASVASSTSWQ